MSSTTAFPFLLTLLLLALAVNSLNWQGAGTINSTVISKIWEHIDANMTIAYKQGTSAPRDAFTKALSDDLNQLWNPAWNVVTTEGLKQYDSILYGYAFRGQWMWFNAIDAGSSIYANAIIVWKDYNCDTWSNLPKTASGFSTAQKDLIKTEAGRISKYMLLNDIWGAGMYIVEALVTKTEFRSGGYSVIFSQYGYASFSGYICMVPSHFYSSQSDYSNGIITDGNLGRFFLFETRLGGLQ